MLRSAAKECLRPQRDGYFGAQSHTPRSSCVRFVALVTSGSRNTRLQTGSLRLAWAGLSPADRASLLAPSLCPPYAIALALLASPALAQDPIADFYKGKQVSIVIGSSAGGGYDTYARLLARHLGKHIPGNPVVVPTN